ncbi:MAG: hypothetical protein ACOX5A_09205 [Aminivibrio sp.]|jgi:hypothetical protein
MAIVWSEDAAREMNCPFMDINCAGSLCLAWQSKGAGRGSCLRLLALALSLKPLKKPEE